MMASYMMVVLRPRLGNNFYLVYDRFLQILSRSQ